MHAMIAHLQHHTSVIRQIHWILYADNAQTMKQIVILTKMKLVMNAILLNLNLQQASTSVIKVMHWIQFAENVRLMNKIVIKMSLKLVQIALLHHNTNVIRLIHWTQYADNVLMERTIVSLIKMKHAVSAIQFNLLFQIQLISVIKLMNWILSAENVR